MGRITAIIGGAAILALVVLVLLVNHYRDNAIAYKDQRDANAEALTLANATIGDMQVRQREVAALDEKHTKELAIAKETISDLRRDVDSGVKRLRVAATCSDVRKTASAPGVDDAASAELTGAAQRDYFTLRERIETVTKQLTGLQVYVREQCLK